VARDTLGDLQEKVILHLLEGRERHGADDQGPQVGEALVEPPEEVQDERAVADWLAKGAKVIRHLLQLTAVLGDGEIVLGEGAEGGVEVEDPGLSVSLELGLESDPGLASSAAGLANDVLQLHGERPEDPGQDDAVHPEPGRRGGGAVGEDVVVEGVALEGEEDEVPPASIGGRGGVQDDWHQGPDVLTPAAWAWRLATTEAS